MLVRHKRSSLPQASPSQVRGKLMAMSLTSKETSKGLGGSWRVQGCPLGGQVRDIPASEGPESSPEAGASAEARQQRSLLQPLCRAPPSPRRHPCVQARAPLRVWFMAVGCLPIDYGREPLGEAEGKQRTVLSAPNAEPPYQTPLVLAVGYLAVHGST